ncbi:MAG: hypothetical protein PWQ82_257 [Thermosediminibacterales bacterium]|nr:hypothetical protein [Thermosediminibacterales bacterium]MDK2835280.1 hypothetical protein [Thermosediminibacterales bacterium]
MEYWKKNLYTLWFVQVCGMMTITYIVSFIPLYISKFGITDVKEAAVWSGLLFSSTALVSALIGPFWGTIADRYGRKIMVERVVFSNFVISMLLPFVANIYQFLGIRIVQGFLTGITASCLALVTSFTPEDKMGFALGFFQTAIMLGASLGPLAGGFLADVFGYKYTFIIMGLSSFLAWILVHFFVEENFTPNQSTEKQSYIESFAFVFSFMPLLVMATVNFLIQYSNHVISPVVPLLIKEMGVDEQIINTVSGSIIAVYGIFSAISAVIFGILSDRMGQRKVLLIMTFCSSIILFVTFFVKTTLQLALLRALLGTFIGGMIPTSNALIASMIPEERRGATFGVTTCFSLMGNVLGPFSGGFLSLFIGLKGLFLFTAIIMFGVFLWINRMRFDFTKCEKSI